MANPNTAARYIVQNPAEHVVQRFSRIEVEAYAEAMKAEGRKVRVTKCYNGRVDGRKHYVWRCFVYPAA